jgi:mono/diheme cytochrome c family protein
MTLEQMAPSVEGPFGSSASAQSADHGQLLRGRDLYLTRCAKCHRLEPIGRYSEPKWEEILPDMAHESKLKPEQLADLRAYVLAAHAYIVTQPTR